MNKICPHCNKEFQNVNVKVFANHVRWCDKNPNKKKLSGDDFNKKLSDLACQRIEQKYGKILPHIVHCNNCGKEFQVFEREKQFPLKDKYFCCRSCSNRRIHTEESKRKISEGVVQQIKNTGKSAHSYYEIEERICEYCGNKFTVKKSKNQKCCSSKCSHRMSIKKRFINHLNICKNEIEQTKLKLRKYRNDCKFTFSLNQFPEEFDFKLIEKYGWYKAKNHGNNLIGVSRDHMYSVMDGFINQIDPKIISHPANCKLMIQNENASKYKKSSITLDELLKRIEVWNKKYAYVN